MSLVPTGTASSLNSSREGFNARNSRPGSTVNGDTAGCGTLRCLIRACALIEGAVAAQPAKAEWRHFSVGLWTPVTALVPSQASTLGDKRCH